MLAVAHSSEVFFIARLDEVSTDALVQRAATEFCEDLEQCRPLLSTLYLQTCQTVCVCVRERVGTGCF